MRPTADVMATAEEARAAAVVEEEEEEEEEQVEVSAVPPSVFSSCAAACNSAPSCMENECLLDAGLDFAANGASSKLFERD